MDGTRKYAWSPGPLDRGPGCFFAPITSSGTPRILIHTRQTTATLGSQPAPTACAEAATPSPGRSQCLYPPLVRAGFTFLSGDGTPIPGPLAPSASPDGAAMPC